MIILNPKWRLLNTAGWSKRTRELSSWCFDKLRSMLKAVVRWAYRIYPKRKRGRFTSTDTKKRTNWLFTLRMRYRKIWMQASQRDCRLEASVNWVWIITRLRILLHRLRCDRFWAKHVEQKGSLVNGKVLRFDFSHFAARWQPKNLVEDIVGIVKIRENIPADEKRKLPIEEAKKFGARSLSVKSMAILWCDHIRSQVLSELCGGTHVPLRARLVYSRSFPKFSGDRCSCRIEAITADEAEKFDKR